MAKQSWKVVVVHHYDELESFLNEDHEKYDVFQILDSSTESQLVYTVVLVSKREEVGQ